MATTNKNITLHGNPVAVSGKELQVGESVPDFKLTADDLSDIGLRDFQGQALIISAVPSLDTPVCAVQTKRFNEEAAKLAGKVKILTVSRDLPFAQKRWCAAEGVENLTLASDHKYRTFGQAFGVDAEEVGILARAVFVVDPAGKIVHVDYVPEISEEPDYEAVLTSLASILE